jgi:large subunit ribosomal protein L20
MVRIKGGKLSQKRRRHILESTRGFRWGRKSKLRLAKDALFHAGEYAFRDRRTKKRNFRRLWQIKIGTEAKNLGLPYSQFINRLKSKNIILDRKILASLAEKHPDIFQAILEKTKS